MRRLPLTLEPELYERLVNEAKREDRDPIQQARAILRRVLVKPLEPSEDD